MQFHASLSSLSLMLFTALMLSGCDRLGIADPAKESAIKEADARATGGGCRHAGRGIEDCYTNNPGAGKSAVFAGWKEMNDYMRENKMEDIKPAEPPTAPAVPPTPPAAPKAAH